jgi:DNA-binding MarR family transcriptional regulator
MIVAKKLATPENVASALSTGVSLLFRRLRQPPAEGELTLPQRSALVKIELNGPTTSAVLAKLEQISPQAMGVTVASLESSGLIARSTDPTDGRCVLLSTTSAGRAAIRARAEVRNALLAEALAANFTPQELELLLTAAPLLERLGRVA